MTVSKDFVDAAGALPLVVALDVREEKVRGLFNRNLLLQTIQQKLSDRGVPSEPYRGNFKSALLGGTLSRRELLAPKLVIEIEVNKDESPAAHSVWCSMGLVEYSRAAAGSRRLVTKRTWSARREMKGIAREDIEDNLVEYVQGELAELHVGTSGVKMREDTTKHKRTSVGVKGRQDGDSSNAELKYSVQRNDPGKRNLVLVGASVGHHRS